LIFRDCIWAHISGFAVEIIVIFLFKDEKISKQQSKAVFKIRGRIQD